jgi:uncharacterized protein YqgV (UPF0045/DUF77 family)
MNISIDISMYPLKEDFEGTIIEFIKRLRESPFKIEENGLSTQVMGPYEEVMDFLRDNLHEALKDEENCVFVMKIVPGDHLGHEPTY